MLCLIVTLAISAFCPKECFAKNNSTVNSKPVFHLVINTATQQVAVFFNVENAQKPLYVFPCSTGKYNNTFKGSYKTSDYYDWRAMLGNVYARYAVRFNKNELLHSVPYLHQSPDSLEYEEFNKLGTKASLGCCRLAVADMKWIHDYTCPGTPVDVIEDPTASYPLTSPIIKIDVNDTEKRGWDPTDADPDSPWNNDNSTNN